LLVSAVRYQSHGRARKGVASNYVAECLKKGSRVRVKLRPNRPFALPAWDRDIIMVGPGTGVAPFRAFLQERRAAGANGRSWLYLWRPPLHPRFPLSARMAGGAEGCCIDTHGCGLFARRAAQALCAAPHLAAPARSRRLARGWCIFLRLRR